MQNLGKYEYINYDEFSLEELKEYLNLAEALGLGCLVEAHDAAEVQSIDRLHELCGTLDFHGGVHEPLRRRRRTHAADAGLLAAARRAVPRYTRGKVVEGVIGTCDSWNCAIDRVKFLRAFYGSLCEEMEGDAVAQICQSLGVPFLAIRIISNSILKSQDPWDLGTGPACQRFVMEVLKEWWARGEA